MKLQVRLPTRSVVQCNQAQVPEYLLHNIQTPLVVIKDSGHQHRPYLFFVLQIHMPIIDIGQKKKNIFLEKQLRKLESKNIFKKISSLE